MSTHDLIVTYKNTENQKFPLILIIGREPSNDSPFTQTTGTYDFDAASKCAFWNTSYASVGSACGRNTSDMKKLCRLMQSSPIAFTDASPVPINNSNENKRSIRQSISKRDIEEHVVNISKMNHILDRTKLVLLSGHRSGSLGKTERKNFGIASTLLEEMMSNQNIPCLSVPFMYGTNQSKIISEISGSSLASNVITDTMNDFTTQGTHHRTFKAA